MALKIFCQSCGSPTEFVSLTPKFCSSCGVAFGSNKPPSRPPPVVVARTTEPIDPEEEEYTQLPNIQQLEFDIISQKTPKITLGQVALLKPSTEKFVRPKPPKLTKKQFEKQWSQEAGGGGRAKSIEIGGGDND